MLKESLRAENIRKIMEEKKAAYNKSTHLSLESASSIILNAIEDKVETFSPVEEVFSLNVCLGRLPLSEEDLKTLTQDMTDGGFNISISKNQDLEPYTGTFISGGGYVEPKYYDVYHAEITMI